MKRNTSSHKWRAVILLTSFLIAALSTLYFSPLITHAYPDPEQPVGTLSATNASLPEGASEKPTNITMTYVAGEFWEVAHEANSTENYLTIRFNETLKWTVDASATGSPLFEPEWMNYTTVYTSHISVVKITSNGTAVDLSDPATYKFENGKMCLNGTALELNSAGDFVNVEYSYEFNITIGTWTCTQVNSTIPVSMSGSYTVNFWLNHTVSSPGEIAGGNVTFAMAPPDKTRLSNHTLYINGSSTSTSISGGIVSYNMTNLVANATDLNFNAEDMVKVSYPRVTSRIKTWEYADSLYSGLWAVEANVTNSFSELTAENVTLTLQDFTATPKLEVHRTAVTWTMYLDGVETTPDSSTLGVSLTHNVTIGTLVKKNFTLVEELPWAFVYNKTGGNIISSSYSEPMKLTFKIQAPTTQNVTVWCELTPYAVIFNGTEQPSNVWSYSHPFLKMNIPLSTKEVVVKTLAPWLIGPVSANHREIVSGTGTVDATVAADTKVIYNTTGAVMIDVARYEGNPGTAFRGDIGKYIDVHLNSSTSVNGIEVRLYYTDGQVPEAGNPKREEQLKMYYWDGTKWAVCSNTGVNTAENYIWAKITSTTTPSLSDLAGTPFAASSPEYPVGGTFGSVDRLFLLVKLAGQFITDQWPTIAGISMLVIGIFVLLYRRKK